MQAERAGSQLGRRSTFDRALADKAQRAGPRRYSLILEQREAGLRSARAQGRSGRRQPKLMPQQKTEVIAMLGASRSATDVARLFRVTRATISRVVSSVAQADV